MDPSGSRMHDRSGIVFVGNCRIGRNPCHELFWNGLRRRSLVRALAKRYGSRFHLYGRGWDDTASARGPLPHCQQVEVYSKAEIVFGGYPGVTYEYYTSDREFIALGSGTPLVNFWAPGVERFLKPGEHWLPFRTKKELFEQVDWLLDGNGDRGQKIEEAGAQRIEEVFTMRKEVRHIIALWRHLAAEREQQGVARVPLLPFVLPAYHGTANSHLFVRNWAG